MEILKRNDITEQVMDVCTMNNKEWEIDFNI